MSLDKTLIAELIGKVPVIPVLVIDRVEDAASIAQALVAGGLTVLEVTLRTSAALAAVSAIRKSVPGALVGVGSVVEASQFKTSTDAGAQFAVSPGATQLLHQAAEQSSVPWLPGAQSVSEVLSLRELGYRLLKFFPAQAAGGLPFLRSIAGPVADIQFCPTGGVSPSNARDYLSLPNVRCVGGSWLTPSDSVAGRRWDDIRKLAEQASNLAARS